MPLSQFKYRGCFARRQQNGESTDLWPASVVTPDMGSSLINDSVFAHHISRNLIEAAQPLFATGESELAEAVQDVFLDDRELMKIAKRTGT